MYRQPLGDMRRPSPSSPSRLAHPNLTIRTSSIQPTRPPPAPQSSTSSPPEQPYPIYPIAIPPEKQEKALRLYEEWQAARYEEELAHRQLDPLSGTSNHHGYHLSVPGTPTPRSATSRTSSKRHRAASVSTSAYGGVTDMSSVISFDGNESSSSANPKAELSTFDGKKVKPRRRKKFDKARRARTALVRHLGSCWVCNKRRVPCDLEQHHDIRSLEIILQSRSNGQRSSQHQSHASMSGPSQRNAVSASAGQATAGIAQTDALFGLGQNELLQTSTPFDLTHLDIQSPAFGDPSPDISAPATLYYGPPDLSTLGSNPYASYQDGSMFPIGVRRDDEYFHCQHFGGFCFEFFPDPEQLQAHFEAAHFSFTRIHPAHKYVCSPCQHINEIPLGPCYNCGTQGRIEVWIYGNYIRNPSYQRHSPDGQDSLRNTPTYAPYYPSTYNAPNSGMQDDQGMNGGNFTGGANPGNYNFQSDNTYGGGPSPSYDYNPFNSPGANGGQFQGNRFRRACNSISEKTHSLRPQTSSWQKLLFVLAILSIVVTLCLSYTWLFAKVRSSIPHSSAPNLPVIGFVGIVASFAMCSSVKHFTVQRVRSAQCRPQKCPLHALSAPMRSFGCRQMAPDTYVRGGICS